MLTIIAGSEVLPLDRAGKSSKMSERGLLLGVKSPQSSVEEILQDRQLCLI